MLRDGRYVARFVCYVDANTVRERLDTVVPGEWDLTLDLLPVVAGLDEANETLCSFKARLQILGVIREDVGTGRDYKSAATDAFKRAAVRFGVAHELYAYEQNWVEVDGEGKSARPLEDPAIAYARRFGLAPSDQMTEAATVGADEAAMLGPMQRLSLTTEQRHCPKCGGRMWDNRSTKRNPKAPDYKCRDRSCDGVIWPGGGGATAPAVSTEASDGASLRPTGTDELPF
ncbi:MAG: hypothetical protein NVS4B3_20520 [Gemmatimonadaceae bacterium]